MTKRVCRDCPVPGCGAKYLVRLANHLADVHLLDIDQRRKYLQQAKLQPKRKIITYHYKGGNTASKAEVTTSTTQDQTRTIFYEQSIPRNHKPSRNPRKAKRLTKGKRILNCSKRL